MNLTIDELNLLLKMKTASDAEKTVLLQDFLLKTKSALDNLDSLATKQWQEQELSTLKNIGEEVHRLRTRLSDKIGTPNAVNPIVSQNKAAQ